MRPAAFNWYKCQLALVGVMTLSKFIAVRHAAINANGAASIKALEAKREAERKRKTASADLWYNFRREKKD